MASLVRGLSRSLKLMMDWMVAILFFNRCASSSTASLRNFCFVFKSLHEPAVMICRPYNKQGSKQIDYHADYFFSCPGEKREMRNHERPPRNSAAQHGGRCASARSPDEGSKQALRGSRS